MAATLGLCVISKQASTSVAEPVCTHVQVFNVQTLLVKFASCAAAVGSGLPVGPEGPMVHIGAMVCPY